MNAAVAPLPRVFLAQTRAQLLNTLRLPAFSVTTIALPIIFYAFFGLSHTHDTFPHSTVNVGAYLMASFGAYGVSSAMVFNFGMGVALARGQKLDLLQRATPLPPAVAVAANVVNAVVFGALSVLALSAFVYLVGGVRMPAETWLQLIFRLLVGALPLVGLGMAIGYSVSPNAAAAVTNLIYLPMSFASGLFIPVSQLPDFIQKLAPYLPTYHYGQLAWNAIGADTEPMSKAVLNLAIWTLILFGLALRAFRLEQSRKFA
jgi:ABC-2 type transport system permease protein